jgi:hypothetical protein
MDSGRCGIRWPRNPNACAAWQQSAKPTAKTMSARGADDADVKGAGAEERGVDGADSVGAGAVGAGADEKRRRGPRGEIDDGTATPFLAASASALRSCRR